MLSECPYDMYGIALYELWILRTAVCLQTLTFVRGRAHRTYLSGSGLVMTRQMCAWLGADHIKANYRLRITGPPGPVLSRPPPYGSPLLHIEMHSHLEVQVGTIKTLSTRRAPLGRPSKIGVGKPHLGAKKDHTIRMAVDYRRVNGVTKFMPYPNPRIEPLIERIAAARFISKFDACQGYYQIPLTEAAKQRSVFITPFGTFRFNTMPFGMVNAAVWCMRVPMSTT